MESATIDAAEIPSWSPNIARSQEISPERKFKHMHRLAGEGIRAAAITYSDPEPLLVSGERFLLFSERRGLVDQSTYLYGDYDWRSFLPSAVAVVPTPDRVALVAGNPGWKNYYHWTFQCLSPVLLAQGAGLPHDFVVLAPQLNAVMRDGLALCGVDPSRVIEIPSCSIAMPTRAVHSNLSGGDFAFDPHPAIIAAFEQIGRSLHVGDGRLGRVYLARSDATSRRMENEAQLIEALRGLGFSIVTAGGMRLEEQIALVRNAEMIVAPHGAGLTNLLFCEPGTRLKVVELFQENYIGRTFLKICQAKGLDYTAILNPVADIGDGRHLSTWRADIPLILKMLGDF